MMFTVMMTVTVDSDYDDVDNDDVGSYDDSDS
jgi:hypothetical protein